MQDVEDLLGRLVEISEVKTPGGWRGWVAVRAAGKERFSKLQWEELLAEPEKLLEGAERTLKSNGCNIVVVKYLAIGGRGVKAVLKQHRRGRGVREFFRSLGAPRAMRNFIAAVKISQYGLPVAAPLAAVYRKTFLLCRQSIYISEYVEGINLHRFLQDLRVDNEDRHRIIKRLTGQMAEILAVLHERGMFHRDTKATNFIVSGNGPNNYKVVLTDLDGIKQYSARREEYQMRALWRLAASVMGIPNVRRTDYLRMFRAYCDIADIPTDQRRELFRELAAKALAKYGSNSQSQTS
ncbi:MAG: lipopolysaccharide core heptose(II) kinase RfaY [Planctomycetota bacterium]